MLGRGVAVALALACARAQVMVLERAPAHDDAIPLLALAASPYVPVGPVLMVTAAGDDAAAGAPPCEHMMMDAVDDDALDDDDVDGLLPALFARVLALARPLPPPPPPIALAPPPSSLLGLLSALLGDDDATEPDGTRADRAHGPVLSRTVVRQVAPAGLPGATVTSTITRTEHADGHVDVRADDETTVPFAVLRSDVALEFDFAPADDASASAPPPPPPLEEAEPPHAPRGMPCLAPVGLLIAMSLAIALAARAAARCCGGRARAPREDAREVLIVHLPATPELA